MTFRLALRAFGAAAALIAAIAASSAAFAGFKITAPLKGMNRPDLPCCTPFYLLGPPNISGDYVVFTSRNGPADGIWSYRISTKALTKLAGYETPVPHGSGTFIGFGASASDYPTTVGGSTVVFFGRDADNQLGIYAIDVAGGTLYRVADTHTPVPGGTSNFNDLRFASTNGGKVVFWGNDPQSTRGIYTATIRGGALTRVIDSNEFLTARTPSGPQPDYYGLYTRPTYGKSLVQFYANGVFDPVTGPNAIFRAQQGFRDIADNMTRLQGSPAGLHARIGAISAAVGSDGVAFAADQPTTGYAGIFKVRSLDLAEMFVSTRTAVPGLTRKFNGFLGFGYDDSGLAFTATFDLGGGGFNQSVYFVSAPGAAPVRVANGAAYYLPTAGDRSISGGNIVFYENSSGADTFYLAVPQ